MSASNIVLLEELPFGVEGAKNFLPYYTSSPWSSGEDFILYYSDKESARAPELRAFFHEEGRDEKLADLAPWTSRSFFEREDELLHGVFLSKSLRLLAPLGNRLLSIELASGQVHELFRAEEGATLGGPFCSDRGQTLLAGFIHQRLPDGSLNHAQTTVFVLDLRSNAIVSKVELPLNANHFQFLPGSDELLFAHEGKTETIPDRLNCLDWRSGKAKCIYKQAHDAEGRLLEFIGHEKVAGSKVVAVRYSVSLIEPGIVLVDPKTCEGSLVDSGHYWHSSSNLKGDVFAMDTMWWGRNSPRGRNQIDVVVFDSRSGRRHMMKSIEANTERQAFHPHPSLNDAGDKLLFCVKDNALTDSFSSKIFLHRLGL